MKVLLTGSSGFLGWPVLQRLNGEDHAIMALSRTMPEEAKALDIKWLQADLSCPLEYRDRVRHFAPEVVIHMAWQDIPDYSFETSWENLKRSLDLLSFLTGLESCHKMIVTGSCWELNRLKEVCMESEVGTPKDYFTWAKHALRTWLEIECRKKDIRLNWMRIFYVYGPRQRAAALVPSLLNHLKRDMLPQLRTPLNANDFVFVDDVADAIVRAVAGDLPDGICNLGSGSSTPVLEVCRTAEWIVNGSDKLTMKLERETAGTKKIVNFWADCSLSRNVLGWTPVTNLSEGISLTWEWMKRV